MSDKSNIGWTDATWSTIYGCLPVSEGCKKCWAAQLANMRAKNPNAKVAGRYESLTRVDLKGVAHFSGKVRLWPDSLTQPLKWRAPRRIFVTSQADTFHPAVPFEYVDKIFAVMALCHQHTFQVLTKRPKRMADYLASWVGPVGEGHRCQRIAGACESFGFDVSPSDIRNRWPLPNVHLGTSCEDQKTADERVPHLLRCPAAVRFLSCEPLLGPLNIETWLDWDRNNPCKCGDGECAECWQSPSAPYVSWVIAGAESGRDRRPADPAWFRLLRDQCRAAGKPFFLKQMEVDGKIVHDPALFPEDLRIQDFPEVRA